ncbi:MAG: glycoside hydrolase family 65 protein [Streptococcaceae bacterium]|nr:glycoside hydrolase family 65 protein [Streptococcaceae bacterium]
MNYTAENLWIIQQKGFDPSLQGKSEAIMTLGNGYMGSRSTEEEDYIGMRRDTFVAGTFNQFDENEVTELPNMPDLWNMNFKFNGRRLSLLQGMVSDYQKSLNLQNGELTRSFIWEIEELKLRFHYRRFISKTRLHFLASELTLENLTEMPVQVEAFSGINGQMTNSGSQHFTEGVKGYIENRYLQMMPQTSQSKIDFVLTVDHRLSENLEDLTKRAIMDRRAIYDQIKFVLKAGSSIQLEKRANVYTSIDKDLEDHSINFMRTNAIEEMKATADKSFDELLAESGDAWQQIWQKHPIKIQSNNFRDQLAIRFAQYHLHSTVPAHDERMNIGAKALSGEGYKGHAFWDTEVFMLPYFTFAHPEIAKSLVTYRYLGLEGAHKKAKSNNFEGAQFPWEAAWPTDGEVTPLLGAVDVVTGLAMKIWSGLIEQHITSDIAFAVKNYIDVTGDVEFARDKAYELLIDTAKFWSSRLEWSADKNLYEIRDVIGPDEYKEHINNNAYTNYTAAWNIRYVINLIEELKTSDTESYGKLDAKFNLSSLTRDLQEKLPLIFLPEPTVDGIIPQDDSYLTKKIIDLSPYMGEENIGRIHENYNTEQVNQIQVTKQADVLLLMLLFEGLFDKKLKLKNFDYYEPKTTHDSSLSLSTHAILSADLGKLEQSYDFFKRACDIDMGDYMRSSDDGIHAASLGGIWQMTIFGYGGVRMVDGKLRIEPHLPAEWSMLDFGFDYQGESLSVSVNHDGFTVQKKNNGTSVSFSYLDKIYTLVDELKFSF